MSFKKFYPLTMGCVLAVLMSAQKLLTQPHRWRTLVALGWLATGLAVAGATAFD